MVLSEFLYIELWSIGGLIVAIALLIQIIISFRFFIRKSELRKLSLGVLVSGLIILGFESFNLFGYSEILKATQDNDFYNLTISIKDNGRFELSSPTIFGTSEPQKGNCIVKQDSIYFYNSLEIGEDKYYAGLIREQGLYLVGKSNDTVQLEIIMNKIKNVP